MHRKKEDRDELTLQLKEILIKEKSIVFAYLHGSFLSKEEFNDVELYTWMKKLQMRLNQLILKYLCL